MRTKILTLFYFIFLLASTMANAFTSTTNPEHPFLLAFDDEKPLEVQNNTAHLELFFQIPAKHVLYTDSIQVQVDDPHVSVSIQKPSGIFKYDEYFGEEKELYQNQVQVLVNFKFALGNALPRAITGQVFFQGCSQRMCFRVDKIPFQLPIVSDQAPLPLSQPQNHALSSILIKGGLFAVLFAFLAGILTSVTPCVIPMIPLTLAFMGITPLQSRKTRFWHLSLFLCGMIIMYVSLGFLSVWLGKTLGFLYQSTWFLLAMAGLFLFLGAWLLGWVHPGVLSRLQNKVVKFVPQGPARYVYAGLTLGLLAAPCVGPLLGPLLVYVSVKQNVLLSLVMMVSYAFGLGILFFILGFFSHEGVLHFAKKADMIKKICGALLLLVGVYYLYLFLCPFMAKNVPGDGFFLKDDRAAQVKAQQEQKGLMLDFYADWCAPCRVWDQKVWLSETVRQQVQQNFVPVKIDCTHETPQCQEYVTQLHVVGWPTLVFIDASGREVVDSRLVGETMEAEAFLKHLGVIQRSLK